MLKFPKISNKAFLAPMAGITDTAFRSICTRYGAGMTVSELISAKGLLQNNQKTKELYQRANNEKHFAIQLFGSEEKDLAQAAKLVEPHADFIDLNLGCPAQKVCRTGAGSELLKHPDKIGKIVKSMVDAVNIPITVKTRIGINNNLITLHKIAKQVQDNGASLLTIHGRTRDQAYGGTADWNIIKEIKQSINIPVVGNGDITTPEIAKKRLEESGVDYIAIGRAASGNPLLFSQINDFLKTGKYKEYSVNKRLKVFEEYLELSNEFKAKLILQKVQAQHFTKGLTNATKLRNELSSAKNSEEILEVVKKIK